MEASQVITASLNITVITITRQLPIPIALQRRRTCMVYECTCCTLWVSTPRALQDM